ncbi:MAG: GH92 family glycosyl hydrolase [Actinomycetota bacterium]
MGRTCSRAVWVGIVVGVIAALMTPQAQAALQSLSPHASTGAAAESTEDLAGYVDPFVGTLGSGFVFPGPAAPYGMVQLSPDTEGPFAYTGYSWSDQFIRGFSHVHVESMGVWEGGSLPFMPTAGPIVSTDVKRYQSKFNHANEEASPGYYRVSLDTYQINAELTTGLRVGMHRYTFPPGLQANVLIDAGRQIPGGQTNDVQSTPGYWSESVDIVDARTVVGTTNPKREGSGHACTVHFAARFDRDFASSGVWEAPGQPIQPGVSIVRSAGGGAYVSFDTTQDRDVVVKVGISFVSQANALTNLEAELPGEDFNFDGLRARTREAWNEVLRTIAVTGGTDLDKRAFYTALYHAQHHPNIFSDANGEYLGHDGAVHRIGGPKDPMRAGSTYYANFSMWDTYRAEMPLLALIAPDRFRDMMRSLGAIKRWGGRLPRWSLMNRYPDHMVGEPGLQVIADGYCRGLVPDDSLSELYDGARTLALKTRRDPSYLTKGYVPEDINSGGASRTLEHASGDFALALMADRLGQTADRDALLALAGNWRNVFDDETRFVRPRLSDGSWMNPYFPESPQGFVEGTGWQYTWLVPHDLRGLFNRMGSEPKGGDGFVVQQLDTFFSAPAEAQQKATAFGIVYVGNQYAPSNEHDLQAPYLYNWIGQPWKTQALGRAYQGLYRPTPDGLPGNDDLGTMSAWYVWSALGFYPVVPGSPTYTIASPVFERAAISLPEGKSFVVEAPGASLVNKYVQSAALGGMPLTKTWFTHEALAGSGTLRLEMGPLANEAWGTSPDAAPPSMSSSQLRDFACRPVDTTASASRSRALPATGPVGAGLPVLAVLAVLAARWARSTRGPVR